MVGEGKRSKSGLWMSGADSGALRASLRDPSGTLDHESCEDSGGAYRKDDHD
jgi:hypothetical protein